MPAYLQPPEQMPPDVARIYGYLAGEILRTRTKWTYFRQLFMDSSARTGYLGGAGANFFREVQNILIYDLILSVARLTDPAEQGKNSNLTLLQLVAVTKRTADPTFSEELRSEYLGVESTVASLRAFRMKKVAHFDLPTIVSPETQVTPGLLIRDIRVSVESIESFLGKVHTHFSGATFLWEEISRQADADALLAQICKARVYDDLVKQGTIPRDLWRGKWG